MKYDPESLIEVTKTTDNILKVRYWRKKLETSTIRDRRSPVCSPPILTFSAWTTPLESNYSEARRRL
jgi:hypothetical protein